MKEKLVKYNPPAESTTPKDDAFHGSPRRIAAEWWYFDAIFNNNYSAHLGFKTFSRKNLGFVSPMIEIYKNGELEAQVQKRCLWKNFQTSKTFPLAKLFNKPFIEFDIERYNKTGEWIYHITSQIEDYLVNLTFIGATKGWKIETKNESWTVALPKARVNGELVIKDKKIKVEGVGYHDHNWNYSLLTVMNYGVGWYWGKIKSKTYNVVWAKIDKSSKRYELLAIVNKDDGGFYNINHKKIVFETKEIVKNNRWKIPTVYTLKINDEVDGVPIDIDVEMVSKNMHHYKALVAPYWRHHMKTRGHISLDNKKEEIDDIQIAEYLKFSI
jgi:predicted secreted hydrolase